MDRRGEIGENRRAGGYRILEFWTRVVGASVACLLYGLYNVRDIGSLAG